MHDPNYLPTAINEIEASIDYLCAKSASIARLLDAMHLMAMDLDRWGLNNQKFYALHTHLCDELLRTETDKELCERDLSEERSRDQKPIQ